MHNFMRLNPYILWWLKNCLSRQSYLQILIGFCACCIVNVKCLHSVQTHSTEQYLQKPLSGKTAVKQVQSADNNKEWCTVVHFLSKKTINLAKQQNQLNISYSPSYCLLSPTWTLEPFFLWWHKWQEEDWNDGHGTPSPFSQEQDQQKGFPGEMSYKKHTCVWGKFTFEPYW